MGPKAGPTERHFCIQDEEHSKALLFLSVKLKLDKTAKRQVLEGTLGLKFSKPNFGDSQASSLPHALIRNLGLLISAVNTEK